MTESQIPVNGWPFGGWNELTMGPVIGVVGGAGVLGFVQNQRTFQGDDAERPWGCHRMVGEHGSDWRIPDGNGWGSGVMRDWGRLGV